MKSSASNNLVDYPIRFSHPKYMKSSPRSASSSGQHRKNRQRYNNHNLLSFESSQNKKTFIKSQLFNANLKYCGTAIIRLYDRFLNNQE